MWKVYYYFFTEKYPITKEKSAEVILDNLVNFIKNIIDRTLRVLGSESKIENIWNGDIIP